MIEREYILETLQQIQQSIAEGAHRADISADLETLAQNVHHADSLEQKTATACAASIVWQCSECREPWICDVGKFDAIKECPNCRALIENWILNEGSKVQHVHVAVDIGCIECGENSHVLGVFRDRAAAQAVLDEHANRQAENWRGEHRFFIYSVAVDAVHRAEY